MTGEEIMWGCRIRSPESRAPIGNAAYYRWLRQTRRVKGFGGLECLGLASCYAKDPAAIHEGACAENP